MQDGYRGDYLRSLGLLGHWNDEEILGNAADSSVTGRFKSKK